MSSKKSKLDLIVRARYQNPIPAPAFPPLLVDIPVSLPLLAGKPDLTSQYAASLPLPMMIDSEIGMPLDLNVFDGIWSGETKDNTHLNPLQQAAIANGSEKKTPAALDPEDMALLEAPSRSTIINGVVSASNFVQAGSLKQTYHKPEVAWLRNTTYLSRDTGKKVGLPPNGVSGVSAHARPLEKRETAVKIDASMLAQQQAIEKTFWVHDHTKVEDLRHPLKPHLRAVDTFDILPDEDAVKLNLNVVNFSERPAGSQGQRLSEEELETSILRPKNNEYFKGFHFYVVQDQAEPSSKPHHSDDEDADSENAAEPTEKNDINRWFEARKEVLPADEDDSRDRNHPTWKTVTLPRVRDYEISGRDIPNEIVLTFYDGTDPMDPVVAHERAKSKGKESVIKDDPDAAEQGEGATLEKHGDGEDDDDDDLFGDEEISEEANDVKDPVSSTKDGQKEPQSTLTKRKDRGVYYGKIVSRVNVRKRRMLRNNEDLEDDDLWDNIILAYEGINSRKKARFDDIAKMFDPDWIENEMQRDHGNEEVTGDAIDEMRDGRLIPVSLASMSSLSALSDNGDLSEAPSLPRADNERNNGADGPVSDAHSASSARWNQATPLERKPVKTYSKRKNRPQPPSTPATVAFRKERLGEDSEPEDQISDEEPISDTNEATTETRRRNTSSRVARREAQTTLSKPSARKSKRTTSQLKREIALSKLVPTQTDEESVIGSGKENTGYRVAFGDEIPAKAQISCLGVTKRRGRPPEALTDAAGKKPKDDGPKTIQNEEDDLSQSSELTKSPSSPEVPATKARAAKKVPAGKQSESKSKETAHSKAEPLFNGAKKRKTTTTTMNENDSEGDTLPFAAESQDSEVPKSKRKPVQKSKLKETASKRSTDPTGSKPKQKPAGKNSKNTVKPVASTSSTASSPTKAPTDKRNGKIKVQLPSSTQLTDPIEAMYFGSSQPYASGTTMFSDSESSDEDERQKVSRLFDPVKRTPQKRKVKDTVENGCKQTKKAKQDKKGVNLKPKDSDDEATSAAETAAESETECPKLRRDLDASNGTNVYCRNGRLGLYFAGTVTGFDDLSHLPPAKRKKYKEGFYLIKLPIEDDKVFKKRRKDFCTENDVGFATCKLGESAPYFREDGQLSTALTRLSTPPLPDSNEEEDFEDLDYMVQLQLIRPHLERIIREEYPPAQQRIDKFFSKAKAFEFGQWYGNLARHYIDEIFIPELTRWALRRPVKIPPSEDQDMNEPAVKQPLRSTGSQRYEALSEDDRELYVRRILLNEAIIYMMLKSMKLEDLGLEALNAMWADDDLYPGETEVERKTAFMRDLVARQELDRLAQEEPDAYMTWSTLMETRNQKRQAAGLPLEGEKKPEEEIAERKGRAARPRNAVSYRE
ncbi:hypothetical protein QFC19_003604 [Naganishia cerealis]|uniref:Uncharacterized protein n=1 Tax=Naganishia cerealis TaxID=610337 RepID=A0ACC2W2R2_9TREE|nr:hypothetical protein QFC19_003604 [Naganishia cerealis]